ncbi:MAG: GAF domain-containing sensor histidine kinase [Desulfococcus multivorans]|jgi:signal transduction histidine kinase|nr:GAF domain-containing sensor histidine kinase [Desulfococcus multivorans]
MNDTSIYNECLELATRVEGLKNRIAQRREEKDKISHLNAVLSSIRDVSRLIIKEKDPQSLIQGICSSLIEKRSFHNAWIVLVDEHGRVTTGSEAGLGADFQKILQKIENDRMPRCCHMVLSEDRFLVTTNPCRECLNCPVSYMYDGRGSISARLEHDGRIYGILTVSVPIAYSQDPEEHELFKDVADDIAYALHSIDVERDRKRKEVALREARDKLERRVRERTRDLEVLSSRLLNAQEAERKRIAADLHDGIGQCLSAVKFMVETVIQQLDGKVARQAIKSLDALVPLLQESSEEIRNIIMNLRPSILDDLGILATIGWFCRQFTSVYSHIRLTKTIEIEEDQVPETLKIIIFRIVQEAMNNIAKYADAGAVSIYLGKKDNALELRIEDNGRGFSVDRFMTSGSSALAFGLTGMKERAELSGGSFRITSSPGKGTRVEARWGYSCLRSY